MTSRQLIITFGSALLLCMSSARAQTPDSGEKPSGSGPGAARPPAARPGGEARKPPPRPEAKPRKPRPRPGEKPREGKPGSGPPAAGPEGRPDARPAPGAPRPEARPRPDEDLDEKPSDKVETNAPLKTFRGPEPIPKHSEHTRGLLIKVGIGVNHCTDDFCQSVRSNNLTRFSTEPMLYLRTQGLFQLGKYFATGLHMAYLFSFNKEVPNQKTRAFWSLFLGPEARLMVQASLVDFWASAVLGYFRWMWDVKINGRDQSRAFDAFAVAGGFGADYVTESKVVVGISTYIYKPFPIKSCSLRADQCDKATSALKKAVGIWWSLGFVFTYFLPL